MHVFIGSIEDYALLAKALDVDIDDLVVVVNAAHP